LAQQETKHPADSVGIACGSKVIALDIDADDLELAVELHDICYGLDRALATLERWGLLRGRACVLTANIENNQCCLRATA